MRIIFAGTPEFACLALKALLQKGHEISLVLTQPDRPAGRGMKLAASPVKQFAELHHIPVMQPSSLKNQEIQDHLAALNADVMVVAAYGLLLPHAVLSMPRLGCLNIHASILPRWRGAAPMQRALLAGDKETGISIMQMDAGLDTGDVLLDSSMKIEDTDTAQSLHDKLAALGGELIVEALDKIERGELIAHPQNEAEATYAAKLTKAEAKLDWQRNAIELARAVRAYNSYPVAQLVINGETIRVWKATPDINGHGQPGEIIAADKNGIKIACGEGVLILKEVQKAGGKRLSAEQFLQGNEFKPGNKCES